MTTPILSTRMRDNALAALALTEAFSTVNIVNAQAVFHNIPTDELVEGLLLLADGLRHGQAAAMGVPVEELTEQVRAMYLTAVNPA